MQQEKQWLQSDLEQLSADFTSRHQNVGASGDVGGVLTEHNDVLVFRLV
jgi:hypothetical protein